MSRSRHWLLSLGFMLTGMVTTILGPILPFLASRWRLNDSRSGLLFTAQFGASMAGVLLSGYILSRRGPRICLVIGYASIGVGVAALAVSSWTAGMIFIACYGFGLGWSIPTTNLLIAELNPDRRAAALNTLNLAWGLGAVALPVAATGFLKVQRVPAMLFGLGTASLLICAMFTRGPAWSWKTLPAKVPSPVGTQQVSSPTSSLVILGMLFFLYVGTENSFGGWTASFARRIHAGTQADWALVPSFFWAALLLGRAVAPFVLRRMHEIVLARTGLFLTVAGAIVVLSSGRYASLAVGVALAGLGLSSIFPITISQFSYRFGHSASRFVGGMFALAGLGGATLPWLVGFTSHQFGSLRMGLWIPALSAFVMWIVYLCWRERNEMKGV
ncbi:MAG: MFS transporter [Candidatus Acidiferrales bacterium]